MLSAKQEAERVTRTKGNEWFWLAFAVVGFGITALGHTDHYSRIVLLTMWSFGGLRQIYILGTWKKRNA